MIIVSDASPIIFFCKIRKLELLSKLYEKIIIPEEVFEEITKKAPEDEKAYLDSWKSLFSVEEGTSSNKDISKGEEAAIKLAKQKKLMLIVDDHVARMHAEIEGVRYIGTLGLLLLCIKKKHISKGEFREMLGSLINSGFRISIEVYNHVLKEADL